MCLWPSYRLPFIQTQYFLNAAQFDGAALSARLRLRRVLTPSCR